MNLCPYCGGDLVRPSDIEVGAHAFCEREARTRKAARAFNENVQRQRGEYWRGRIRAFYPAASAQEALAEMLVDLRTSGVDVDGALQSVQPRLARLGHVETGAAYHETRTRPVT